MNGPGLMILAEPQQEARGPVKAVPASVHILRGWAWACLYLPKSQIPKWILAGGLRLGLQSAVNERDMVRGGNCCKGSQEPWVVDCTV